MNNITNVQFFDPVYTTNGVQGIPTLKVHEAYGYMQNFGSDLLLSFIIQNSPETLWRKSIRYFLHRGKSFVVKGLMIPKEALVNYKTTHHFSFTIGNMVKIVWKDIVYLENVYTRPCHTMKTLGTLYQVQNDFVVIQRAKTIRTWPWPRRVHAKDAEYLVLPISLIISCTKVV